MKSRTQILRIGILIALVFLIRYLSSDIPLDETFFKTGVVLIVSTGILMLASTIIRRILATVKVRTSAEPGVTVKDEQKNGAGAKSLS